ncbi:MAG: alpha/beta hydrolase [Ottowia sp.]
MRRTVSFTSQGAQCVGWLYLPDDLAAGDKAPAVVMANAITATKEMVLPAYAEQFAAAGFAALAFDFRFLGESGGEPRGQLFASEQIEDLRNAVSWLSLQPEVDANQIGAWGASFGGAHVLYLAAFDKRIKAAVAAIPSMRTIDTMVHFIGRQGLGQIQGFLGWDRTNRYQTGAVTYMKTVSDGTENAMLPNPEANEFYNRQARTIAPNWNSQVTVESLEKLLEYDPAYAIEFISPTPLLMIVGEHDMSQPANLSLAAYARAGEPKKIVMMASGHTEMLEKPELVEQSAAEAIAWFKQYLS